MVAGIKLQDAVFRTLCQRFLMTSKHSLEVLPRLKYMHVDVVAWRYQRCYQMS